MDQESEGTNLVIFVVGGVVLLLLLLGGGAFFFFAGWHEESVRKEVEATSPVKEIHRGVNEFNPEPMFPVDAEKGPANPDGASSTLQDPPSPKAQKELPKGPAGPPPPPK